MTCEEALKKLYDVIDNEASEIDLQRVQEHLDSCESCMSRYEFEKLFKHFVIEKASPPSRTDRLKSKVLDRIESYDPEKSGFKHRRFRFIPVFLAAAASLVICLLAAFSIADYYRHKAIIEPYEDVHFANFLDSDDAIQPVNVTSNAIQAITNDLHLALNNTCEDFVFIDARAVQVDGNALTHLRCRCHGVYVSLLVDKADDIKLPNFEKMSLADIEYFQHVCKRCQVLYWYVGDGIIVAVCDNVDLDMTGLITAVQPI
jgi:mycothiol system anti-sigma-R factor